MAAIYPHISLSESLSLSLPGSEAHSHWRLSFCCHLVSLSRQIRRISLLYFHSSSFRGLFRNVLLSLRARGGTYEQSDLLDPYEVRVRRAEIDLMDQREMLRMLSAHSRWSFEWRQTFHRPKIKILRTPLETTLGTKRKMKLWSFAM